MNVSADARARVARAVAGLAAVVLLFDALVVFAGDAPLDALARGLSGTWGTAYGAGQVIYKATPLLFSGVAFHLAHRAGLFNIGTEGQMAVGGLAAGVAGALLPRGVPAILAIPAVLCAAAFAGGVWAAIPGFLRARFGAHEVIATIMTNRITDALLPLALASGLGATSFRTANLAPPALVPRLSDLLAPFAGSAASLAALLAVVVALAIARWQRRSRIGRELGWIGENPDACAAAGIPVRRRVLGAMVLSGGVAGLAASATVQGYKGYFELGLGAGAGFGGIAVALLGGGRPARMLAAALLVGTLQQAGLVLNATVPKEVMDVLFGGVILVVALVSARGRGAEIAP